MYSHDHVHTDTYVCVVGCVSVYSYDYACACVYTYLWGVSTRVHYLPPAGGTDERERCVPRAQAVAGRPVLHRPLCP